MTEEPQIRIEVRACAACGAVVVDHQRHREWHVAIKNGAGRALEYRPHFELIGLIDAPPDDDVLLDSDFLTVEDLFPAEEKD